MHGNDLTSYLAEDVYGRNRRYCTERIDINAHVALKRLRRMNERQRLARSAPSCRRAPWPRQTQTKKQTKSEDGHHSEHSSRAWPRSCGYDDFLFLRTTEAGNLFFAPCETVSHWHFSPTLSFITAIDSVRA